MSRLPRCSIPFVYLAMCPDCNLAFDIRDKTCPKCGSEHVMAFSWPKMGTETRCGHCGGAGGVADYCCPFCGGTGRNNP